MKNSNQPINPIYSADHRLMSKEIMNSETVLLGLSKREYFAGVAMQGMLANSVDLQQGVEPHWHGGTTNVVKYAISFADELLKQLELNTQAGGV